MSTHEQFEAEIEKIKNLPEEEKRKLDERAHNGEVVVPGGTGGKSLEAQIHLAEGKTVFGRLKRSEQMVAHVHEAMGIWNLRRRKLVKAGWCFGGRKLDGLVKIWLLDGQ